MKKRYLIFILLIAATVFAVDPALIIRAPGSGGMNSDADNRDINKNQATYMLNLDVTRNPFVAKKRDGLDGYLYTTDSGFTSAVGVYDPLTKWKAFFGTQHDRFIPVGGFWIAAGDTIDSNLVVSNVAPFLDSMVTQFVHSAKFGDSIIDTIDNWWMAGGVGHDYTKTPFGVIHADGSSPVAVLALSASNVITDSVTDAFCIFFRKVHLQKIAAGALDAEDL